MEENTEITIVDEAAVKTAQRQLVKQIAIIAGTTVVLHVVAAVVAKKIGKSSDIELPSE